MPESAATRLITEQNLRDKADWAYVEDYLDKNRNPGVTDDRPAFEAARLTGKPVRARTGTFYLSKSPDWGDNSVFVGAGRRRTVIKLLDTAPADVTLWGNASIYGTTQGYFADFTLDGNCQRQGGNLQPSGGSRSSCMTLRNVNHFYVDRVEAINGILHGFDVTRGSVLYPYLGDGNVAPDRSTNVYFDQCEASNFGDDGFTTHSSDYVHFSRCVSHSPRLRGNNNGFEVDGDSRHVTLTDNRTYGCYAGVEVKGHADESAAQDVTINGHHDTGSVRSYNFRHIGFHDPSDPTSQSARNIVATNLVSIEPNNDKGFQDDAGPRALCVSAYRGVTINGLTAVGRGDYAASDMAVSVQFKASDVNLSGLNITGWGGAGQDISITTGDRVNINSATVRGSAARAVYVGPSVTTVKLRGLLAEAPVTGSTHGIGIANSAAVDVTAITATGYTEGPIKADGFSYPTLEGFIGRDRQPVAGATTILAGCPIPGQTYFIPDPAWGAMTDRPTGSAGAPAIYEVKNGPATATVSGYYRQDATRISTVATVDSYFRIVSVSGLAGPWYKVGLTQV